VGSEYSQVLMQIRQAAQMLDMGSTSEVAIQAENMTTLMRLLNEEYFIAVTMRPQGNIGKARFLLRTSAPKLLENLT
jgi:predicted regulator of Ras-like GTPase activity (Roadblock/LC7/MglB family)